MILTKKKILEAIKRKEIVISPFNKRNVGAGSIDLTLDNKFRIFVKKGTIKLSENVDYKKYTKLITANKILLNPGEIVLGITKEKLKLPEDMCGWLQGRSRFARLGLVVHVTASFVQPGSENKQVLEIINLGKNPIEIHAGDKICQLIIERTEGKAKFKGKFVNQKL
ncbi:MAG: dCTP deaminase [Nanoarchaeota archaeon]|nr:dCTP deaminase [Nanoarchaeota archaeon]